MLFKTKSASDAAREGLISSVLPPSPTPAEDAAAAFLEQIVEEIPTVFGRLTYLAALRHPENGSYRHPILSHLLPEKRADHLLRRAHRRLFVRWLEFSVRQQRGDLTRYFGYGAVGPALLRELRDRDVFSTLAPSDAANHERVLFTTDLAIVLNSDLFD